MAPNTGQAAKRRALPLDRTVKWLPLHDAYYLLAEVMTSTRALPLVVMQEALLQVEAHASSEVYGSTCGVLCGAPYKDPTSGVSYLLVEGIERGVRVNRDGDPAASLAAELSIAIASAERAGRTVVGWYCFDVALSQKIPATHAGIHRSLFPEPLEVALLRDGSDGEGSGAFVRVEPTEGRAFSIPFMELIPRKHARGHGPRRTSIEWSNYSSESEVVPLPVEKFRDASPPAPKPAPRKRERAERVRRPGLFAGALGERPPRAVPRRPVEPRRDAQPLRESPAPEWTTLGQREGPRPESSPFLQSEQTERRVGSSPLVKGASGLAAVLLVSFFMARGDASSRSTRFASESSGDVAAPAGVAENAARGAGTAGSRAGGFTPEERSRAWLALAQIAELRGNLAARLDTLHGAILAARGASDPTVLCARAALLYESALGDRAKIVAARKELTQLVGPMRMAGVDSLTDRTTAMQPLLTSSCR
jgi:hypothetical protein